MPPERCEVSHQFSTCRGWQLIKAFSVKWPPCLNMSAGFSLSVFVLIFILFVFVPGGMENVYVCVCECMIRYTLMYIYTYLVYVCTYITYYTISLIFLEYNFIISLQITKLIDYPAHLEAVRMILIKINKT